jgi:ATP-binding cassette subfamily F protein 3
MLRFEDIGLRRGPRLLFEHASFRIFPGQKVGLTGANGTGKSSLFDLILDQLHADSGELYYPGDWVVAHVAQQTPSDSRAAIEYVLDGDVQLRQIEGEIAVADADGDGSKLALLHGQLDSIDGYAAPSRAGRLMSGLGFSREDESRPVSTFSGGWRMRLNLARALMCRSDLLLLDEPTNHLDLDTVIWLEDWLKSYPGTLMLIAHDRDFLDAVTSHIAQIEDGRINLYTGNYSAFERLRAQHLATHRAEYEKQQKEIVHIRSFVDRFRAKASKARQAQSRIKALERMEFIAPAHVDSPFQFSFRQPEKIPYPLLRFDEADAGYGTTIVLKDVDITLNGGDRLGLLGRNGAGKSTFIKLLAGMLESGSGKAERSRDLRIGYFAQHQLEQLDPDSSALERLQRLNGNARDAELRKFLGGFGFSNDQALMPTRPFSGGEKSRLALALIVFQRPNLLLLDEPTNHLDLEMRQALAMALQNFSGATVLVSHDRHLLRVCCDELLLVDSGSVSRFQGTLDDYPRWLRDNAPGSNKASRKKEKGGRSADRKERKRREAEKRNTLNPLRRELAVAEKKLGELQTKQKALENELAAADLYTSERKADLSILLTAKSEIDRQCLDQEDIWMRLCQKVESAEQ